MAGSIMDNAAIYKKTLTYIPSSPPIELIDSTNYTLNFVKRKFIHIGVDPSDMFRVVVHIITPSRYINISTDFLQRIFSLMGNILSFILEQPGKYKRTIFLETENFKLSSMMYSGENTLVVESKIHDGCRVLLNRTELIRLQYLEWCIFETIIRKSTIMQPIILNQFEIFTEYIDRELIKVKSPPRTSEEMIIFIKNIRDDHIITSSPKHDINFISQLKMLAFTQLAEHSIQRWNKENMSPELFDGNVAMISPTSPSNIETDNTSDTQNEEENNFKAEKYINEIGRFYKPWFFKHVESFLLLQKNAEEYIPLKDYYFRHNNSLFWEVQDIIPFENHPVFRYLLGWIMPAKVALLKLTQTDTIKRLYNEHHFIDDFILPISCLKKSVEKCHKHLNIYPIWVCPTVLNPGHGLVHSHASVDNMYIDIGLYGEPNVSNYNSDLAKDLELFVLKSKGFKMMYVGTYLNIHEFKKMFNHCLYQRIRMQLNCEYNFPEVYDKVNKKVRR